MTVATVGYYQLDQSDGMEAFALVELNFYNANPGFLDDSGNEEPFVPSGFYAMAEGIYEHEFDTVEEAKAALEAAGWVEKQMF